MALTKLNCPGCGAPLPKTVIPNQPFKCPSCSSVLMISSAVEATHMTCSQCETLNPINHKYCSVCRAKLLVDCPICYLPNSINSKHCAGCKANIQEEMQRRSSWRRRKAEYDKKRKEALVQALENEQKAVLERLLSDLDEPERHAFAIYYLCQQGDVAFDPLLETLQGDPDPDARYGAARVLGMIGNPRAVPHLIKSLSDPEPAVRYWAIDALVMLDADEAKNVILDLIDDPYDWVGRRALNAMNQLFLS